MKRIKQYLATKLFFLAMWLEVAAIRLLVRNSLIDEHEAHGDVVEVPQELKHEH